MSDLDTAFNTTFLQDLITLHLLRNRPFFFNLEEINFKAIAMTAYSIDRTHRMTLCTQMVLHPLLLFVQCAGIRLSGINPQGQIYFPT